MKHLSSSLENFVNHFKLMSSDGTICFDAIIHYKIDDKVKNFESQVQVITIEHKKIDVLYLLNKDISNQHLPDMFTTFNETILYIKERCLIVFGSNNNIGDFEVFIYSKDGKRCRKEVPNTN